MTYICRIPFGRRRAFDCKMSGANLCFFFHLPSPPSLHPPCLSQVCQLPCRSELGQMVAGKKCLLAHSSEQNEQMPAEPPITVTPTGGAGEGRRRQKPCLHCVFCRLFSPGSVFIMPIFHLLRLGMSRTSSFPPCARRVKCFSKAKAGSRVYFPPKFWTLSYSSLFLTAFHCLQHKILFENWKGGNNLKIIVVLTTTNPFISWNTFLSLVCFHVQTLICRRVEISSLNASCFFANSPFSLFHQCRESCKNL